MKQFLKKLYIPKKNSHKGDNGVITIIAGSKQYHGSALLAIKIAAKIVDLVYFYSTKENQALLKKLKIGSCEFINISKIASLQTSLENSDAVLIGPGLEINNINKNLINKLLKKYKPSCAKASEGKNKKFILDAGALRMLDKKLLNKNIVITPHINEYKALFGDKDIKPMAKKYKCTIVLKGAVDAICNSEKIYYNKGGNAGMTKGGTGDVLAGLIAALAAKNDALTAAFYGSFFNKKAAESLYRKVGFYYNATDLADELPKIINKYHE